MSIGQGILLIVLVAAVIAIVLLIWNSQQRKNAPARSGRRRDLDVRIDSVISGAGDASDRAVSLVASPGAASTAADWSAVRADMLAVEGDIVDLGAHVGQAQVGRSLAELASSARPSRGRRPPRRAQDRRIVRRTCARPLAGHGRSSSPRRRCRTRRREHDPTLTGTVAGPVFTADHGDMMGDHGLIMKGVMHFQGCLRVPVT